MKLSISLKTKVSIVFLFLFVLLILAALPYFQMKSSSIDNNVMQNYQRITQHLHKERLAQKKVIEYLENLGFAKVQDPKAIFDSLSKRPIRGPGFEVLTLKDRYYLHIITPHFRILFEDKTYKIQENYLDIFVLLFIVMLFIFIYYLILKNITNTQHQLKSRQLFLRTVMHELKTPIAKGRIVSELIDDEKQKNRIITIFEKLNFLIDDFAKVEQLVSKNYNPNIHSSNLAYVVNKSVDMLMLEDTSAINVESISHKKINVDSDLLAMAFKNLIDNALKYSNDAGVNIQEKEKQLLFISNGEKLQKPLDEYFQPFHNDKKLKNHGMGLGLYIVNAIVQMHNMKLEYQYENNQNIFQIILEK